MGQCFSFALRRGRRNVQIDSVQKSPIEGKSTSVATSRRSFRRSPRRSFRRSLRRSSTATEECEVEPVSGFFSLSDYSKASGLGLSPINDGTPSKEQRTFGKLIAEEDRSEAMRRSAEVQKSKSRATPERPPALPSRKAYGAGQAKNSPSDRKSAERTRAPSAADSMITKGRRSLDRMRAFPPAGNPNHLKKGRSRTESFTRSAGSRNSSNSTEPKLQTLPGPVDFDFLAEKFTANKAKQTSQSRRDGESSRPIDLTGPEGACISSLSAKDIDEFTKSYRKSAAKARALDRDAFKYMSSGTSETDLSITSSVGMASPARPRKRRHTRTASNYSLPEIEQGMESSMTFATLMKQGPDYKHEAASPSTLGSPGGLTRNKSSPSFPGGTTGVKAKSFGLPRNRSSPSALHRADRLTAGEAQAEARHDAYASSQMASKAGKLSSSTRPRRPADTIPEENLRNLRS